MVISISGIIVPHFQGQALFFDSLTLNMKTLWSFWTSVATHQASQCHIAEHLNLQESHCLFRGVNQELTHGAHFFIDKLIFSLFITNSCAY